MLSTLTKATISAATTTPESLALVSILALLCLLIQKEVTTAAEGERARALGRFLMVGIVPLAMVFFLVAAVRLSDVLR
jgi:hypothetical protein